MTHWFALLWCVLRRRHQPKFGTWPYCIDCGRDTR